jgi:hypothetical protein
VSIDGNSVTIDASFEKKGEKHVHKERNVSQHVHQERNVSLFTQHAAFARDRVSA